jgi:hypothetical protein
MRNTLGPIVAEPQMRLAAGLEFDPYQPAPRHALFRDTPGPIADGDEIAADQRAGERNAKLSCEMAKAGPRLTQGFRKPRALAISLLRLGSEIDEIFDQ